MITKHTPGPWETVFEGHRLSVWSEGYGFVHSHEVPQVNIGATQTANANARLISAAPELLQALRDLQKELRDAIKLDVKKHYSLMVADACASKAIAKAEGKD